VLLLEVEHGVTNERNEVKPNECEAVYGLG
jgi:hypothetical protein